VATFLGLITGLLIWYIGMRVTQIRGKHRSFEVSGNGGGNGNPYGLAASYAVFTVPVMFVRLFAPAKYIQSVILGTVCIQCHSVYPSLTRIRSQ
jgi:hypothetical protein